jgi:hypothetical protein
MKSNLKIKRCATCGQKLPTGAARQSRPLSIDARFKRAKSSLVKTFKLLVDQRGRSAAKAALRELEEEILKY